MKSACPRQSGWWLADALLGAALLSASASALATPIQEKSSDSGESVAITWESVLTMAHASSPVLGELRTGISRSQSLSEAAGAAFRPTISSSYSSSIVNDSAANTSNGSDWRDNHSLGLSVKQNLFAGFRDHAIAEQRESAIVGAKSELREKAISLRHDLRRLFDQLLYYQDLLKLNDRALERKSQNLTMVRLKYEGGMEHKGSVLKSEASVKQTEIDLSQARRGLTLTRLQLETAIGQSLPANAQIVGELRQPANLPEVPDFDALARYSPARQKAQSAIEEAKAALKQERSQYMPVIDLVGSIGRSGDWFPEDNRYSVGINLSWVIWDGGQSPAKVRAAAQNVAIQETIQTRISKETRLQVETDWINLLDARSRVVASSKSLEASSVQADLLRSLYPLGQVGFQEWDQVENDLINNERQLLVSRRDVAQALAAWERSLGLEIGESKL